MHSKVLMRLRWCLQLDTCLDIRLQTRTSRTKAQVRVLRTHLYFRFWYPHNRPKLVGYINTGIADTKFGATDSKVQSYYTRKIVTSDTKVNIDYTKVDIIEELWSVLGISIWVSLLTGGSMELMWSLANTLQIMFFYGTLNLYLSTDLKNLFSFMRYSNFDNPVTDYISNLVVGGINIIKIPVSSNFSDLGFGTTNIITNSFLKVLTVMMVIFGGILLP